MMLSTDAFLCLYSHASLTAVNPVAGDQTTGAYLGWPTVQWCNSVGGSAWDPRFRPWYAIAAAGPKDVVIIMDTSGSMQSHGRIDLARDATIKVLDTLWGGHLHVP